jgi:hypothetical protein
MHAIGDARNTAFLRGLSPLADELHTCTDQETRRETRKLLPMASVLQM